jgi:drug/metabolite transporter (DMT)-like permease
VTTVDHRTASRLLVLAAALLFSTGGAGLKADAFSAAQASHLRSGIAAIALLLWLRGGVHVSRATLVAGVWYAATVTLFVGATKLTTAANAIFLQSAAPLYIVLFGRRMLGEQIRARDIWFLVAAGLGLWLCFLGTPPSSRTAPDPATGNVLAALCSVTWMMTLVSLRRLEGHMPVSPAAGLSAVVIGNAVASLVALPFAWPLPAASAISWATVAYLGLFQIGLAYWCLTRAVRHLPALEVSLLLLIEPVLNPLWTWLLRGEDPGALVMVGGAIILICTAVRTVLVGRSSG